MVEFDGWAVLRNVPIWYRARIIQHGTVAWDRPAGVDRSQAFRLALHDKDPEAYAAFVEAYPPGTPRERMTVSRIVHLPKGVIMGAVQSTTVAYVRRE